MMVEERFSDFCDLCGCENNGGLVAIYCDSESDGESKIHICPDCIKGVCAALDDLNVSVAKMGKGIRDFLRGA